MRAPERPDDPVWIVVPTYNEIDNVGRLHERLSASLRELGRPWTLLFVDDGSPDGTAAAIEALASGDPRVRLLTRRSKDGIGPAYRAGFRVALDGGAARVVQMDCDLSHDPADVARLVAATDAADLAIGSRYVPGGGVRDWGRLRQAISRGGCWYARRVLGVGVRDLTGGFKCWRRATLEAVAIDEVSAAGYGFQIEMTWRAILAGAQVVEVPITFRERELGTSKMGGRIVLEAALLVPRLRRLRAGPEG